MYAVKIEFDTPTSVRSATKILASRSRLEAAGWFNYLSMAFLHTKPVPVKGGGTVDMLGASIYEIDADTEADAIESAEDGSAHLISFTEEPDFALNLD
jgi:hypothetical protein